MDGGRGAEGGGGGLIVVGGGRCWAYHNLNLTTYIFMGHSAG